MSVGHGARVAAVHAGPPRVQAVHYPDLVMENDPSSYDIDVPQMKLFGDVLSFEVADATAAWAWAVALRVVRRTTSLGGTETLIELRASIEPIGRVTSPPGLSRLSVRSGRLGRGLYRHAGYHAYRRRRQE
jgi:cystathionine gamma-synthase